VNQAAAILNPLLEQVPTENLELFLEAVGKEIARTSFADELQKRSESFPPYREQKH
jgi:hypothetical protein